MLYTALPSNPHNCNLWPSQLKHNYSINVIHRTALKSTRLHCAAPSKTFDLLHTWHCSQLFCRHCNNAKSCTLKEWVVTQCPVWPVQYLGLWMFNVFHNECSLCCIAMHCPALHSSQHVGRDRVQSDKLSGRQQANTFEVYALQQCFTILQHCSELTHTLKTSVHSSTVAAVCGPKR